MAVVLVYIVVEGGVMVEVDVVAVIELGPAAFFLCFFFFTCFFFVTCFA